MPIAIDANWPTVLPGLSTCVKVTAPLHAAVWHFATFRLRSPAS